MRPEDSILPLEWLEVAKKDWLRMRLLLEHGDAGAAGYFLQQSLEKYLKAFLLGRGWKLRKIHELDALLDFAVEYNPGLEAFRDLCERVSGYYSAERYPPLQGDKSTGEDIAREAREAEKLIEVLVGKPGENHLQGR